MLRIRKAFYAAFLSSLLRTKSLLRTIFELWIFPTGPKSKSGGGSASYGVEKTQVQVFLDRVEGELGASVRKERLITLSNGLKQQFLESMATSEVNMLPSYNHRLPSGNERGTFLALDVGGTTFRVAVIELLGKGEAGGREILKKSSFKISEDVRNLEGVSFFDWMAERIEETILGCVEGRGINHAPLGMGLSWSFPIEQTSLRSGRLQGMGKRFLAAHGLLGQDLGDLIQASCSKRGLNVRLNAIVNDSTATLLSRAYGDSTTRLALILGTGVNLAAYVPVHVLSLPKFGVRPQEWHQSAKHVIINTEMSMFGAGILPTTKWDEDLKTVHPRPDFQPLEYLVSGGYLGEIIRLVLLDGIESDGLFGGIIPSSLKDRYSLSTETISLIESDQSQDLYKAHKVFNSSHVTSPLPTDTDIQALRSIASYVTYRAAGIVAAGVHAVWQICNEAESIAANESSHTIVAYHGSVIEKYPHFKDVCQMHLDTLVEASGGKKGVVELSYAEESSLLGAAVAGAVASNV